MAWRRLLTQVGSVIRHSGQSSSLPLLGNRLQLSLSMLKGDAGIGMKFQSHPKRLMSSYVGSLARRARDIDGSHEAALLKDLYRSDAEGVIRIFESHPSLQNNPAALSEYLKALVAVDRLDESALLKTLHQGVSNSTREGAGIGAVSPLGNVGIATKDGILGSANSPIHMVAAEGGHFKEQLWRTFRTIALAFLLISGVGALIEDRGISKGLGLNEEVQPSMESNTKFSDVKGVDEAKAELEEIVHYLRDPKFHLIRFLKPSVML